MVVLKNSSKEPHFYSSSLVAADHSCNIKFEQILQLFFSFNSNSVFSLFRKEKEIKYYPFVAAVRKCVLKAFL